MKNNNHLIHLDTEFEEELKNSDIPHEFRTTVVKDFHTKEDVAEIAKISYEEATKFLKESENNVKTACVMAIKKCSKVEAEQMLKANGGILRKVI